MDALLRDLANARRAIGRAPGFTASAVIMLAIGIGMWTLMFSVLNGLILRPLPVRDQDQIILAWRADKLAGLRGQGFRETLLTRFAHATRTFSAVASMFVGGAADGGILIGDRIVYLENTVVSGNFFSTLGAQPALGRTLTPADDATGAPPAVVISYGLWQRQFGGSRSVLGRLVRNNGVYHQIVGVMPATFDIPRGVQAWYPLSNANPGHTGRAQQPYLAFVGRVAPGVSPAAARSEFDAYLTGEAEHAPDDLPHVAGDYRTLTDYIVGATRPVALALTAASALVLLLACFNVANLLVVRSVARQRELAIRTALGAERWAVIRQLIAETGLLGIAAAVAGVAAAWVGLRVFVRVAPATIPRLADMRLDGAVLLAAVGAAWAALLLCGIGPALWLSRGDLIAPLRSSSHSTTDAPSTRRLKRSLVVAQVALAQLVLIGAGLLINSLLRLEHVNLGFRPEHVAFGRVGIGYEYADVRKFRALFAATMPMIRSIPGVIDATVQQQPPLSAGVDWSSTYELAVPTPGVPPSSVRIGVDAIGTSYFGTMGVPVLRGREFTEADLTSPVPIAVVSQGLAARAWPGKDPIGQRIRVPGDTTANPDGWRTVVGVVANDRYRELTSVTPMLYLPYTQVDDFATYLFVRTRLNDAALRADVAAAFAANGPDVWLPSLVPLTHVFEAPLARPRLDAFVLGTFAAIALILAAAGIYALGAAFVRQRHRELGIRSALGARPWQLVHLVTGEAVWLAIIGIALGTAAGLSAGGMLLSELFEMRPTDVPTVTTTALAVVVIAVAALALPCRRAAAIDAAAALREP